MRLELTTIRKDAQYDDEVNEALRTWNDRIQEWFKWYHDFNGPDFHVGDPFQYLNYAAPFQDPFASYGEKNLQLLREVSKKYDPDQVFQKLVPGGFKLNRG